MNAWINECMNEHTNEQMNGWTNEWTVNDDNQNISRSIMIYSDTNKFILAKYSFNWVREKITPNANIVVTCRNKLFCVYINFFTG